MLTVQIINEATSLNHPEEGDYHYDVFVNGKVIACGRVYGHKRDEGWPALLKLIAEAVWRPMVAPMQWEEAPEA